MFGNPARRPAPSGGRHPNEFDLKRIERSLKNRKRYRYVTPEVRAIESGYEIVSACCSRNIDPDGGVIDITRIEYLNLEQAWCLYRKDHKSGTWIRYGEYEALNQILDLLIEDPDREFWQ